MPWCPKCKSEYREGFTICADCGTPLTEGAPQEKEASEHQRAEEPFVRSGRMEEPLSEDETLSEDGASEGELTDVRRGAPYQDSSERASENRSSGWILLIVGALGLVLVVLGVAGVIPLQLGNPYLFFGVMGAVFLLFLVAGVVSMRNARFFDKKAQSENSLRSTMLEWCSENLHADEIDSLVGSEEMSEEELYFGRTAHIRERLNRQFVNLDQNFLDRFVDDHVYELIFEQKE